jgi:hypothetical protein
MQVQLQVDASLQEHAGPGNDRGYGQDTQCVADTLSNADCDDFIVQLNNMLVRDAPLFMNSVSRASMSPPPLLLFTQMPKFPRRTFVARNL